MEEKIKIGVSSCLLGNLVRYDGQHKKDDWLTGVLAPFVEFVAVCPEVECGLSVPREAMRLTGDTDNPRMVTIRTRVDHTERMSGYREDRLRALADEGLCGFVLKSRSPSCGMERVKVYPESGGVGQKKGVGLFASALMKAFPDLPVEEEGRLCDPQIRENFIERLFVAHRWLMMVRRPFTSGDIVDFHTRLKLILMAHSPVHYRELGKMVSDLKRVSGEDFRNTYYPLLMEALRKLATRSKHQNVMLHVLGYFKKDLVSDEKSELIDLITLYKEGKYPIIVPITLLNHYVRKYGNKYLATQYYLNPHPRELSLRNHV